MPKIHNDYTYNPKQAKKLIEDIEKKVLCDSYIRVQIHRKKIKAIKRLGQVLISESSLLRHIRLRQIS